jgi:nitrite reductase/ring-hydroxylating ferredoxin subunit
VNRQRVSRISRSLAVPRPLKIAEDLEHAHVLDRPARGLSGLVTRLLPPGRLKDLLHGVPLGHPAHPPLTDLPVGCWLAATVLDLLPDTDRAAEALVAAGLVGAVPTAFTGVADWSALHVEQQRVGLIHSLGTLTGTGLFAASLFARLRGRKSHGKALGAAGLVALFAGTYLGGHLAFRLAAGASHAESITHLGPLGWHDLCPLDELPDGWPVHRSLGYISLFVLRYGDDVYVLADRCTHLDGPLHQGRMVRVDEEICVVCPWHGSTFRVSDGAVMHGPATGRQPAFETKVTEDGMIQVRPAR